MSVFSEIAELLFGGSSVNQWTAADQARALARGWGLCRNDGGMLELHATDDRMDYFAWLQVEKAARDGDLLSAKALKILEWDNPEEYRTVLIYAERRRGAQS